MIPTVTLFFSLLIAVGGTLLAFWLGARTGKQFPSVAPPNQSNEFQQLFHWLRIPHYSYAPEQLSAWHKNLRIFGVPLATRLHPNIYLALTDALEAIHDVLQANDIEDRYELLAAALLPVYEACGLLAISPLSDQIIAPASLLSVAAPVLVTETRKPKTDEPSRIATMRKNHLLHHIAQASHDAQLDITASKDSKSSPRAAMLQRIQYEAPSTKLPSSIPVVPFAIIEEEKPLDTAELSQALANILKASVDEEASFHEAAGSSALHLVRESHTKSRLKRTPPATPEEEAMRKASHAVGRAREWMGRPDITLADVATACYEFGLEFNERYAQIELQKSLPEEYAQT